MSIGHHPSQPQYTPDMRKKEEDITESEKEDAKRRIEGSLVQSSSKIPSKAPLASLAG
jgi:phosphatidylserine decarboxylase